MFTGYAYCQMVYDKDGKPVDFIYLEINKAFEKLTGLSRKTELLAIFAGKSLDRTAGVQTIISVGFGAVRVARDVAHAAQRI